MAPCKLTSALAQTWVRNRGQHRGQSLLLTLRSVGARICLHAKAAAHPVRRGDVPRDEPGKSSRGGLSGRGRPAKFSAHLVGDGCAKTGWEVHAYVLMDNHFHLVLETPQPNLALGMKWLLGTYTLRWQRWEPPVRRTLQLTHCNFMGGQPGTAEASGRRRSSLVSFERSTL